MACELRCALDCVYTFSRWSYGGLSRFSLRHFADRNFYPKWILVAGIATECINGAVEVLITAGVIAWLSPRIELETARPLLPSESLPSLSRLLSAPSLRVGNPPHFRPKGEKGGVNSASSGDSTNHLHYAKESTREARNWGLVVCGVRIVSTFFPRAVSGEVPFVWGHLPEGVHLGSFSRGRLPEVIVVSRGRSPGVVFQRPFSQGSSFQRPFIWASSSRGLFIWGRLPRGCSSSRSSSRGFSLESSFQRSVQSCSSVVFQRPFIWVVFQRPFILPEAVHLGSSLQRLESSSRAVHLGRLPEAVHLSSGVVFQRPFIRSRLPEAVLGRLPEVFSSSRGRSSGVVFQRPFQSGVFFRGRSSGVVFQRPFIWGRLPEAVHAGVVFPEAVHLGSSSRGRSSGVVFQRPFIWGRLPEAVHLGSSPEAVIWSRLPRGPFVWGRLPEAVHLRSSSRGRSWGLFRGRLQRPFVSAVLWGRLPEAVHLGSSSRGRSSSHQIHHVRLPETVHLGRSLVAVHHGLFTKGRSFMDIHQGLYSQGRSPGVRSLRDIHQGAVQKWPFTKQQTVFKHTFLPLSLKPRNSDPRLLDGNQTTQHTLHRQQFSPKLPDTSQISRGRMGRPETPQSHRESTLTSGRSGSDEVR
ncbi:hypothetical protein C7M84_019279 [Penaeus vannamei]|uniref:Uncharacterized protein n=1 Tax=Penaeus vannamei TaxID=6689 RepID=A0A423SF70_PENVA|nr:hypothetical protein C7M84_019279 [Penaeus vannamei]